MKKLIISSALFFGTLSALFAQQDAQFSHYMNNTLFYNPAFAGVENVTKITLLHRSQWAFYKSDFDKGGGAPTTQVFSITSPVYMVNGGVGVHVVHDQLGPFNNLETQASFAYHYGLKDSKITFGLRTGFFSQTIHWDYLRATDPNDPVLADKIGSESQTRPDLAAGIFYIHEKFYGGVSFNHLLKSSFDFNVENLNSALANHMFFTGGYYYNINTVGRLHSSMMFKTDFKQFNFTASAILTKLERQKEQLWLGIVLRQAEDVGLMFGYHFLEDKSLRVGYSFGYVVSNRAAKSPTSHEVILIYELPGIGPVNKKIEHTPRFRH